MKDELVDGEDDIVIKSLENTINAHDDHYGKSNKTLQLRIKALFASEGNTNRLRLSMMDAAHAFQCMVATGIGVFTNMPTARKT
jgi:hypothetical protein